MLLTEMIGFSAAILTTACQFPQALKTWKTRSIEDVSLLMYIMLNFGIALWFVYGVMIGSWPIMISNVITIIPCIFILCMKIKYG